MVNPERSVKITSASPAEPTALIERLQSAALPAGFLITQFGQAEDWPLLSFTRPSPLPGRPTVYVSAGIHGDEPAAPLAMAEMLESGFFDDRANWELCPLLNPVGFSLGLRENRNGADLNREYRHDNQTETVAHRNWLRTRGRYQLALCLHEDWESTGFYLYEIHHNGPHPLSQTIIDAVRRVGPIDHAELIDGREAAGGIIRPNINPDERPQWPEALYLLVHHTDCCCTMETPSALDLGLRIRMQITAAHAAVESALDRD